MPFSTYTMYDKMIHQNINKSYALRMEVSKYGNPIGSGAGYGRRISIDSWIVRIDGFTVDVADTSL